MNQPITIELFGHLLIRQEGEAVTRFRTQKTATLLGYLACFLHRRHAREELIELLWPDVDLEAGRTSLRTALASLRRQLELPNVPENSVLVADRQHVYLNAEVIRTDIGTFEAALRRVSQAEAPDARAESLSGAAAIYTGPLLPGFYDDWVLRERTRLEQVFSGALRELVTTLEALGHYEQAIAQTVRLIASDPLEEQSPLTQMGLYAKTGRKAAVKRQFKEWEQIAARELGEKPSAEALTLLARLTCEAEKAPVLVKKPDSTHPALAPKPETSLLPPAEPSPFAPLSPPPHRSAPLPLPLTRFFGRETEMEHVQRMLAENTRLLTLTGPGGTGKTRLALEVASRFAQDSDRQVCFVPLADITAAEHLPESVARALSLRLTADRDMLAQIGEALASGPALLVLDNFEQLPDEATVVVQTLLAQSPDLLCLVTSRQCLGIGGEQEFPVAPLPVPVDGCWLMAEGEEVDGLRLRVDGKNASPAQPSTNNQHLSTSTHQPSTLNPQLLSFPSVQMFVDRARLARPAFQITAGNADAIAALCARLEGIPLAIELTAAWAQTLTPSQMLERLNRRFDLLTTRRKDLPPRHRTLRAALEWSYRLLSPELQRFLAHLSIFRGGWTLEAAEAVCEEPNALDYLQQLRERSLLHTEEKSGGMSFRLLETVREYAEELVPEEERAALTARHLRFFLVFAHGAKTHYHGPEQKEWMEKTEQYHDNIREALKRSQSAPETMLDGLRLASRLHFFWFVRGHLVEGYRWITELLALAEAAGVLAERLPVSESKSLKTDALCGAGELAFARGDLAAARAHFAQCLPLWQELGYRKGIAYVLCYLGQITEALGDIEQAADLLQQGFTAWQELNDKGGMAHALKCLAVNARLHGDAQRAHSLLEEGLAFYRELGNLRGINMILSEMANLLIEQGEYARAETLLKECRRLSHELKDKGHTARVLWNLGHIARRQEIYSMAIAYYEQALAILRELGDQFNIVTTLNFLGITAMEQGDSSGALTHYANGLVIARNLNAQETVAELLHNQGRAFHIQGDYAVAEAHYEESLTLYRQMGNERGVAILLHALENACTEQDGPIQAAVLE